jgi:hypothetical protein
MGSVAPKMPPPPPAPPPVREIREGFGAKALASFGWFIVGIIFASIVWSALS